MATKLERREVLLGSVTVGASMTQGRGKQVLVAGADLIDKLLAVIFEISSRAMHC